jgi:GTP-binding protein Era
MMSDIKKCGLVSLLGEPNVGKSTLVNKVTGTKVSIVTHKAQTTRTRIRGIRVIEHTQIILVDTPGVFAPKRRLDRAMVSAAWGGFTEADIILFMLDVSRGLTDGARSILKSITDKKYENSSIVLLLNKIDKIKRNDLLNLSETVNTLFNFNATFMISAEKGSGTEDLVKWLSSNLPESPWLYPEDQIADFPLKIFAAEVTREKLLIRLHQELPYQLTVEPDSWVEMPNGSIKIHQIIYVTNKRHKGMVLGKKGETIKVVSIAARKELMEAIDQQIHLFLQVKVRNNWLNEPLRFSNIGLNFSD